MVLGPALSKKIEECIGIDVFSGEQRRLLRRNRADAGPEVFPRQGHQACIEQVKLDLVALPDRKAMDQNAVFQTFGRRQIVSTPIPQEGPAARGQHLYRMATGGKASGNLPSLLLSPTLQVAAVPGGDDSDPFPHAL
jgi:hypothetical protein